jgi:hypothetical protein
VGISSDVECCSGILYYIFFWWRLNQICTRHIYRQCHFKPPADALWYWEGQASVDVPLLKSADPCSAVYRLDCKWDNIMVCFNKLWILANLIQTKWNNLRISMWKTCEKHCMVNLIYFHHLNIEHCECVQIHNLLVIVKGPKWLFLKEQILVHFLTVISC